MLRTTDVYNVILHELAALDRRLSAYTSYVKQLPVSGWRPAVTDRLANSTYAFDSPENKKQSAIKDAMEYEQGMTEPLQNFRTGLIEATPFFHLGYSDNVNLRRNSLRYCERIDRLVREEVDALRLQVGLEKTPARPFFAIAGKPLFGRRLSAKDTLQDSIHALADEREVLRNLAVY